MADISKLRKKAGGKLGTPPGPEEFATSLAAPETAPAKKEEHKPENNGEEIPYVRRDGRSARKTNRTLAFATRVTTEFDREIRDIAEREGILLVEVLERAVESYKEKQGY